MKKNGKIKVLSTTAMIDDLVSRVGRERIDHLTLIQGDLDPHTYELVKGDDEKFACADLVFSNGLGLEHGASLSYQISRHKMSVSIGDQIFAQDPSLVIRVDGQVDPHIWMDLSLMAKGVESIVSALCTLDPKGCQYYKENGRKLMTQMQQAHREMVESFEALPQEKRYLVTSHDAFNYFVRTYMATPEERSSGEWRTRLAAPEGLAPDGQLSSMHIKDVIDYLLEHNVRTVFPESNVNRDALKKIVSSCDKAGVIVCINEDALFGDSMGGSRCRVKSYIEMIQHNARTIIEGLQ